MCVNGAAARLVHRGDTIIVISYAQYDQAELERYEPRVVHVEANTNRIITIDERGGDPALARRGRQPAAREEPDVQPSPRSAGRRRTPAACR